MSPTPGELLFSNLVGRLPPPDSLSSAPPHNLLFKPICVTASAGCRLPQHRLQFHSKLADVFCVFRALTSTGPQRQHDSRQTGRGNKLTVRNAFSRISYVPFLTKPKETMVTYGLPETAASVAVAATVVGAAATLLARRTKSVETTEAAPTRTCEDCGGSGICPECKGEGFVLKRMADGSAEKARLNAKNMATRYTAGLPKKWSYCTKCLSARSCKSCDGSGTSR